MAKPISTSCPSLWGWLLMVASFLAPGSLAFASESVLDELKAQQAAAPLSAEAAAQIAMYYQAHERHDQAQPWYATARSLDPGDWRWPYLAGLNFSEMARAGEALPAFQQSYQLAPQQLAVAVNLAAALSTLGDLDQATRVLQAAKAAHPNSAAVLGELGILMLAAGSPESAAQLLREALDIEPTASRLNYPLASALRASGEPAAARLAANNAGPVAPRLEDPTADAMRSLSQSYAFYMSQGLLAASSGDWSAAQRLLQRAVEENPADPTAGVNLARVLESQGELGAAAQQLDRVLKQNPQHAPAWFNLGVLAELAGDDETALERYVEALALDPTDFRSQLLAAAAAMRLGQYDRASRHYASAAQLKPERDELLVRVAVSQWHNNCASALQTALELVQRRPEDPAALVLYIRMASTCEGAPKQARVNALNAAGNLSRLDPSPAMQINLAMAQAANGDFAKARVSHQQATAALEALVSPAQGQSMHALDLRYRDQQLANLPFLLNEQVLLPPRLTAEDRR